MERIEVGGSLLSLVLQHLGDNLLLLDKESPHDLLSDCLVAQNTSVCSVDLLLSEGQSGALLGSGRLDTLQGQSGHGALGDRGALLEVLEHQLATGSANNLPLVRLGVVRQSSAVSHSLNHLVFVTASNSAQNVQNL